MNALCGVSSSIFYPPAVYQKVSIVTAIRGEAFFSNFKVLMDEGYQKVVKTVQKQEEQDLDEMRCWRR